MNSIHSTDYIFHFSSLAIRPEAAMKNLEEELSFAASAYMVLPMNYRKRLRHRLAHSKRKSSIQKVSPKGKVNLTTSLIAY